MIFTKKPSRVLFAIRFLGLLTICCTGLLVLIASQLLFFVPKVQRAFHRKLFVFSSKLCCMVSGYHINIHGELPKQPGLVIPNHISYADILVLASLFPASFVAKIQIKSWPLIGWISTLAGTIYVSRMKERALLTVNESVKQRLATGQNVVVFLEGQTSDGEQVLPFRSPILESVVGETIPVIPVSLKWHSDNPNLDVQEHIAYWRNEHSLMWHLVGHLGHTGKIVECYIGEPECSSEFQCRKELANSVHAQVAGNWGKLVELVKKDG